MERRKSWRKEGKTWKNEDEQRTTKENEEMIRKLKEKEKERTGIQRLTKRKERKAKKNDRK